MLDGQLPRGELRAQGSHRRGGRSDKANSRGFARLREGRFLREEAVTGMNRVGATVMGDLDDPLELQIGLGWRRAADVMGFVRVAHVNRVPVCVGVHRGCWDPELAASSHDANGDLASVRDKNLVEELLLHPTASSG